MNNGLVEREKVISTLRRVFEKYNIGFENGQGGFADEVPKAIKAIPAAYDMDKVEEQIKEEIAEMPEYKHKFCESVEVEHCVQCKKCEDCMAERIIEIVKSGGIEESGEE